MNREMESYIREHLYLAGLNDRQVSTLIRAIDTQFLQFIAKSKSDNLDQTTSNHS